MGSVVDYNDEGVVFAVTPDGMSYAMSQDHGDTWFAVNKGKYDNDKAKGLMKSATSIPWETKAGFLPDLKGDRCTAYASPPWNCKFLARTSIEYMDKTLEYRSSPIS